MHWIDATVHLEAAAKLRIVRLPALVIDGRLVVQGPRAFAQLRAWIARQGNDT
ncbi:MULTISPECIES: thioredoxin family protein [Rhodanobacter]|uniref:thioredoxin family protein n=1 Tax=Rhodanobacter TaxID=75309 RepID=UPI00041AFFCD|nr:thioredoxin family protein [Rhodanobacter thiooxydans]UJJ53321.1 thioredoxin family protein [Rhodanobacter thiooxydans]